jgi:hypothetical protein
MANDMASVRLPWLMGLLLVLVSGPALSAGEHTTRGEVCFCIPSLK